MRLPRSLTFSNLVALLALFVALGGSSYAATTLSGGSATVNGGCPGDTRPTTGVCVERKSRAAAYFITAEQTCAAGHRRLPGRGELMAFGQAHPQALTAEEWTDTAYYLPGSGYQAFVLLRQGPTGTSNTVDEFTKHPYRCVTGPAN
jgi:hypothetical protein